MTEQHESERTAHDVFNTILEGNFYSDYDQSSKDMEILRKHLIEKPQRINVATQQQSLIEELDQIITDSIDMGWEPIWAARAIVEQLPRLLPTATPTSQQAAEVRSRAIREFCERAGIKGSVEARGIPEDVRNFRRQAAVKAIAEDNIKTTKGCTNV